MTRIPSIAYIGSKNRVAADIGRHLRATGAEVLVDVFGGAGAVTMGAGFDKRVYNDLDGDLVNMFRVLADRCLRRDLLSQARWLPASRRMYEDWRGVYRHGGNSFALLQDPVQRALATLYRLNYAFGAKLRSSGFCVSASDRVQVKEVQRWFSRLRRMVELGEIWRNTVIEQLPYQDVIRIYGKRPGVVLYCDPPYVGTENYYSREFGRSEHAMLALLLTSSPAAVAVSYYDCPLVREIYPHTQWDYRVISTTVNARSRHTRKRKVAELLLVKRGPAR